VVAVPLAVLLALNVPHAPALPHVTDHVTPLSLESLLTVAVSDAVPPVWTEVGVVPRATEIAPVVEDPELPQPIRLIEKNRARMLANTLRFIAPPGACLGGHILVPGAVWVSRARNCMDLQPLLFVVLFLSCIDPDLAMAIVMEIRARTAGQTPIALPTTGSSLCLQVRICPKSSHGPLTGTA
jgi:hypothetical protein